MAARAVHPPPRGDLVERTDRPSRVRLLDESDVQALQLPETGYAVGNPRSAGVRPSSISTFEECPRHYAFRYALGLRPIAKTRNVRTPGAGDTGSAAHRGIDAHYRGSHINEAVESYYDEQWHQRYDGLRDDDWRDHTEWVSGSRDYAAAIAEGYPDWVASDDANGIDDQIEVLATEQTWIYDDGTVKIIGTWDMVFRDLVTSRLRVRDFKTKKTVGELWLPVHPDDLQLGTYTMALAEFTGELPGPAQHVRARRVKQPAARATSPVYGVAPSPPRISWDRLADVRARVYHVQKHMAKAFDVVDEDPTATAVAIGRAPETRANPGTYCEWKCRYQDLCNQIHTPYAQEILDEEFIRAT